MIQYHPFIVFGAPGTLSNLKELGFKTFSPYIDESYDNEISPFRRMQKITKEIKRLCSLSETEIYNWFTSMKYILIYNRQLMLEYGKQYGKHMENIIGELKRFTLLGVVILGVLDWNMSIIIKMKVGTTTK